MAMAQYEAVNVEKVVEELKGGPFQMAPDKAAALARFMEARINQYNGKEESKSGMSARSLNDRKEEESMEKKSSSGVDARTRTIKLQSFVARYSCDQKRRFLLAIDDKENVYRLKGRGQGSLPNTGGVLDMDVRHTIPPPLYVRTAYFLLHSNGLAFLDAHNNLLDFWPTPLPQPVSPAFGSCRWEIMC